MGKYLETKRLGNVMVVKLLFSELSMYEAEEFKVDFYGLVSEQNNKFVLNLEKCSFLPSIVIGALINFVVKSLEKSGRVVFSSLTEQVRNIFHITKLESVFEVYATEKKALESF